MSTSRARRTVTALVLVAVLGIGTAIALAVRSSTESARSGTDGTQLVAPEGGADGSQGSAAQEPAAVAADDEQRIVRTASLSLTVGSIEQGAAGIRQVARDLDGQVTDERVLVADPGGRSASVTVSVPAERMDAALERLSALGAVTQRTATARDVTTRYVDTESRIASMKASVERVRAMMAQTTAISQLVELESQLAQRESELDSLQRTLAALQRTVAMSTVTVTLATASDPADGGGFTGGLRSGWQALVASFAVCLTVIGAVLPFAVVLAIVGVPALVWWRRRRTAPAQPDPAPEPEPEPASP